MNSDSKMKEVLFDLANDVLYVANGGRPFTRKGVIGICASHLSEKISGDLDNYKCEDKELIYKIRQCEIDTYDINPNRLTGDSRGEKENRDDYQGRFVWELLQNADDVMGANERQSADLIGSKGLGFKSVLEITEEPEIHSGPFHFKFSPNQTKRLLKEKGIPGDPPQLTFRIPHDCPLNDKICGLLDAGYSTVIRLPFRDEGDREKAKSILEGLEPLFLLLSQELESVRIILGGEEICFRVERETQRLSDGRAVLHRPGGTTSWKRWTETKETDESKRLTVAIALPVDENGEAVSHTNELPFHVFFPTEEQLGVKALLHASFDLEQNRKHLREGNYDAGLLDLLGTVLEKVILDIPARTALKTFGSIPEEGGGGPLERIRKTIREKMRSTPFVPVIGGRKVPPPKSRCWKDNLGNVLRMNEQVVKDASLVTPELSDLSDILEELGATKIEGGEYVQLLRYCRNESLEDCIASLRVLMEGGLKRIPLGREREQILNLLRKVPCWWTDNEQARPLEGECPLLWNKPENWPDWLTADSLHSKFREKINEWEKRQKDISKKGEWNNLTCGFLSRSPEHYIGWVLIPFIKKWTPQEWNHRGFDALELLARWESQHQFDKVEPWIQGEEGRRDTLATSLHLPTDEGWLPAINCFAGKKWDGPEAFDELFKDVEEVGIVQPFEEWPEDLREAGKDKWKGLLRWIGVSWEPKVCRTPSVRIDQYPPPSLWGEYFQKVRSRNLQREGKNYFIRYFQECVNRIKGRELIGTILPTLLRVIENKGANYFRRDNKNPTQLESFAWFQLRKTAWLPVKRSILEDRPCIPPNEAFLPNKELNGLLPEVDHSGVDNDRWHGVNGIKSMLAKLGVADDLPNDSQRWHDLMRKLVEKGIGRSEEDRKAPSDWKGEAKDLLWRGAQSLYRKYLQQAKRFHRDYSLPLDIKMPCIHLENEHRTVHFSSPNEVYWIDEPHLTDSTLENELLRQEYKLFILRLNEGDQSERLGVLKLSSAIECRPYYQPSDDSETNTLRQRYAARRVALEKVMEMKFPEDVDIKAVTNLSLKLFANGQNLACRPVLSWREETGSIVVDIGKKKWRALAHALAHRLDNEKFARHKDTFETYLSEDNKDEVLELLRQNGVPEEALEEIENSFQQSPPNKQSEEVIERENEDHIRTDMNDEYSPMEGHNSPVVSNDSDLISQRSEAERGMEGSIINSHGQESVQPTYNDRGGTTQNTYSSDNPRQSGFQRLGAGDQSSALRQKIGLEAEQWLEERLCEVWPDVKNVRTGRDFTLSVGGRRVHIEAKHVENPPGAIHWSDEQYKLTGETGHNGDSYFIAVLSPGQDDDNRYAIHWIWDPLEHLSDLDRNVTWTWSGKSEPLQKGYWNMADTRPLNVSPEKYKIEVKLTDDIFNEENQDGPQLEKLRARIESLNGVAEQETVGTQLG